MKDIIPDSTDPFEYLEGKGVDSVAVRTDYGDFEGDISDVRQKLNENYHIHNVNPDTIDELESDEGTYIEIEVPYTVPEVDLIEGIYSGSGKTGTITVYGTTEVEETARREEPLPADD